jgi:hypothetical protein
MGTILRSCLECFYCKVTERQTKLKCSERNWEKGTGEEKTVKLSPNEALDNIHFRELFTRARNCISFDRDPVI